MKKAKLGYPDNVVAKVVEKGKMRHVSGITGKDCVVTVTAIEFHKIPPEELQDLTREQFHALVKKAAQPVKPTNESDSASDET